VELTEHRNVKDSVDRQLKHFSSRENLLRISESRCLILLFLCLLCIPESLVAGLLPWIRQLPWEKDTWSVAPCFVGLGEDTGY